MPFLSFGVEAVTPSGYYVSTLAGNNTAGGGYAEGVGVAARFDTPDGLLVLSNDFILVADKCM